MPPPPREQVAAGRPPASRTPCRLQEAPRDASEGCFGFMGRADPALWFVTGTAPPWCVCGAPGSDVNGVRGRWGLLAPAPRPSPPAPRASYHQPEPGSLGRLKVGKQDSISPAVSKQRSCLFFWNFLLECGVLSVLCALFRFISVFLKTTS